MKLLLASTFIDIDKKPIRNGKEYAIAEIVEGVLTPVFLDPEKTKQPAIRVTGNKITLQDIVVKNLLSENKDEKEARAKLGWKILMCEKSEIEIGETDLTLIKKVILEKETSGLILAQTLNYLEACK